MKRYHYKPTKPHQHILPGLLIALSTMTYIYLIIILSNIIGG